MPEQPGPIEDTSKHYSEESFWNKVGRYARIAGKAVIKKALVLYYAVQSPDTPMWAKAIIFTALGYFILPTDAIPDYIPAAGFTDDLGALAAAAGAVAMAITPEVKALAREKLGHWFGDQDDDEQLADDEQPPQIEAPSDNEQG